eukprot:m.136282 g.136282  ORF g.136282 m.136282 type:complete len:56 (+) comp38172_c1_seq146:536-703(+)
MALFTSMSTSTLGLDSYTGISSAACVLVESPVISSLSVDGSPGVVHLVDLGIKLH